MAHRPARGLGRGPQRPSGRAAATSGRPRSPREHGLPGVAVSDAHSVARGRRRLHGARWRSVDARPGCSPPCRGASSCPVARRYVVRSVTPIAKVVQRLRGQRPGAADAVAQRDRHDRAGQDHRPMAERRRAPYRPMRWSTARRSTRPPCDPSRPVTRVQRARDRRRQMSLGARLRQPRTILSIAVPLVDHRRLRAPSTVEQLSKVPALDAQARTRCSSSPRSSSSTSASRCVACAGRAPARHRAPHRGQATRPRSSSCRGSSTASCRPSSATSTAPTCSRSTAPVSLSRTFGTVFIERVLDLFAIAILGLAAGFWSFRDGLPPAIQVVFGVGRRGRRAARRRACSRCATSAAGSSWRCRFPHRVLELYDRFEEGVFGAVGVRAAARSARSSRASSGRPRALRLCLVVQALGFAGRVARHLGGGLRRPDRVAADGRAAQPGRARASSRPASSAC